MSTDALAPLLTWTSPKNGRWVAFSVLTEHGANLSYEIKTCRGGRFMLFGDWLLIDDPVIENSLEAAQARAESIERVKRGVK